METKIEDQARDLPFSGYEDYKKCEGRGTKPWRGSLEVEAAFSKRGPGDS